MREAVKEMTKKKLGMICVKSPKGIHVITDGDLRRLIEKQKDISQACAKDIMGGHPKTITRDTLAAKAVRIMQDHSITSLAVLSNDQKIEGIILLERSPCGHGAISSALVKYMFCVSNTQMYVSNAQKSRLSVPKK